MTTRIPTAYEFVSAHLLTPVCTIHLTPGVTTGWVYFFGDGESTVKIGFTTDLDKRESSLRTANLNGFIETFFAATPEIEHRLHALLSASHVDREWFRRDDQVEEIIELVEERTELDEEEATL